MEIVNIRDETEFTKKLEYSINKVIMAELLNIFGKNSAALHDAAKYIHDKAKGVRTEERKKWK